MADQASMERTRSFAEDLSARIEAARQSPAYRNYEHVREQVLRMKERERRDGFSTPSAYWREELAGFGYMLDASPLVIAQLRHHCHHVTGLRPYNYRSNDVKGAEKVQQRVRDLARVRGPELVISESRALGGFGFEVDGELHNVDSLKYSEVLVALEVAGVLDELRQDDHRRVVLEIGAGWGGFPYQFKSLLPDVTYVIIDLPEVFLFSGTYLMTLFPAARTVFAGVDGDEDLTEAWQEADFVFVPNTRLDLITPPCLDLTVNMVSFQEMTDHQVEMYVRQVNDRCCRWLYSLNRETSHYNRELTGVMPILARYYEPQEIPVLATSYLDAGKPLKPAKPDDGKPGKPSKPGAEKPGKKAKAKPPKDVGDDYKHIVASLRPSS